MKRVLAAEEYVSQVGIEPTTRGLKVPCSTTELLAQALPDSTSKTQQYARPPRQPRLYAMAVTGGRMTKKWANGEGSVFRRTGNRAPNSQGGRQPPPLSPVPKSQTDQSVHGKADPSC